MVSRRRGIAELQYHSAIGWSDIDFSNRRKGFFR